MTQLVGRCGDQIVGTSTVKEIKREKPARLKIDIVYKNTRRATDSDAVERVQRRVCKARCFQHLLPNNNEQLTVRTRCGEKVARRPVSLTCLKCAESVFARPLQGWGWRYHVLESSETTFKLSATKAVIVEVCLLRSAGQSTACLISSTSIISPLRRGPSESPCQPSGSCVLPKQGISNPLQRDRTANPQPSMYLLILAIFHVCKLACYCCTLRVDIGVVHIQEISVASID